MVLVPELTVWHIQCIHRRLGTTNAVANYKKKADLFLADIWEEDGVETIPKLEVATVENSPDTVKGESTVRVKFRLHSSLQTPPDKVGELFQQSVRHFCERIFDLHANGNILSKLGALTTHSLLGVSPQSPTFRCYWTKIFLKVLVDREVPIFKAISNSDFFSPWSKGIAVALALIGVGKEPANTDEKRPKLHHLMQLAKDAWCALSTAAELNTREPTETQKRRSEQLTKDFIRKSIVLEGLIKALSEVCDKRHADGDMNLETDAEVQLFNKLVDVLETGFDLLTVNKEAFDIWRDATSNADNSRKQAGGAALAGFAISAGNYPHGISSVAVYGPLAVAVIGSVLCCICWYKHNKYRDERDKVKKQSEKVEGAWTSSKTLAEYLLYYACYVSSSPEKKPDPTEPQEARDRIKMGELRNRMENMGVEEPNNMLKFKAAIQSQRKVISDRLEDMQKDPDFKELFSA